MQSGPDALPGNCGYCRQLVTWEDPEFRQAGRAWLAEHSDTCDTGGGGGGGDSGGGTRRGH